MRALVGVACLAALSGGVQGQDLGVYVAAAKENKPDRAAIDKAKAESEALVKQRDALEADAKSRFGKKKEQWPADVRAAAEDAASAVTRAAFEYNYVTSIDTPQKDIDSSAEGIREKLLKKKGIHLAERPEDADLVVEVLGRMTLAREKAVVAIGLRLAPGGRLDPAALDRVGTIVWKGAGGFMKSNAEADSWHDYKAGEPYWYVEITHPSGMFGGAVFGKCEGHAATSLEAFAKERGASLLACRRAG
jgi:hypothetical protein